MKNTGIFLVEASTFSLSFPFSFSRASPFSHPAFSACFLRMENMRLGQEGRSSCFFWSFFSLLEPSSDSRLALSASEDGWKFQ